MSRVRPAARSRSLFSIPRSAEQRARVARLQNPLPFASLMSIRVHRARWSVPACLSLVAVGLPAGLSGCGSESGSEGAQGGRAPVAVGGTAGSSSTRGAKATRRPAATTQVRAAVSRAERPAPLVARRLAAVRRQGARTLRVRRPAAARRRAPSGPAVPERRAAQQRVALRLAALRLAARAVAHPRLARVVVVQQRRAA
jgi:hypothetical protein